MSWQFPTFSWQKPPLGTRLAKTKLAWRIADQPRKGSREFCSIAVPTEVRDLFQGRTARSGEEAFRMAEPRSMQVGEQRTSHRLAEPTAEVISRNHGCRRNSRHGEMFRRVGNVDECDRSGDWIVDWQKRSGVPVAQIGHSVIARHRLFDQPSRSKVTGVKVSLCPFGQRSDEVIVKGLRR